VQKPYRNVSQPGAAHASSISDDRRFERDDPIPEEQLNDFDYAPTPDHPTYFDDAQGVRCPLGAHIRRMNPRGGAMGGIQHNHRVVRRGVPYGPEYDPTNPHDGHARGLLGLFICGDIATQFEFLQMTWANVDVGTPGVIGTRDPIIGWQPDIGGKFRLPTGDDRGTPMISDLPRLVTTRGSLYCFMPGIGALKALASQ
jgi:deferrochelatase/peroxidase EfeB